MRSFRLFNRQTAAYVIAAGAVLLGAFVPAIAMAADVTERSIELSSSSKGATAGSYTINFKATGTAGAFVVDFCAESPNIGATCTAPTGFSIVSPASTTTNYTDVALVSGSTSQIVVTKSSAITAGENVSVTVTGFNNPTVTGAFYARIVTYDTKVHAQAYTSAFTTKTGSVDQGGVGMLINDTIGVSGAVLESMTFCVAGAAISDGCTGITQPATLRLGEDPGTGVVSLQTDTLSTGDIYTQLTTNATGGAVINLKSSATGCGGLINSSKPSECYITPALQTGINTAAHEAKFGVKLGAQTGTGTYTPATGSGYSTSAYALNWAADNLTGVTSTYGDPFVNTGNNPATNLNLTLTFGASANASTPAGNYSADIGLIATGKF